MANATLRIAFHSQPFTCRNEGWGEFDMTIDLYVNEKSGKHTIQHDLNFANEKYEAKHTIVFKNPSSALLNILRETGPVPGEENGRKKDSEKKRKRPTGNVDIEKLAENLVKLDEESLLQVVQMIHDNKTADTYTKNDVERKFTTPLRVLLYTLVSILLYHAGYKAALTWCFKYRGRVPR